MKIISLISFFITIQTSILSAQGTDSTFIDYTHYKYEILGRDTNTIRVTYGKLNSSSYRVKDSVYVFADIILREFPTVFNTDSLYQRVISIMQIENIQYCYIYRDTRSLWFRPMGYRSKEMIELENYCWIGIIRNNEFHFFQR